VNTIRVIVTDSVSESRRQLCLLLEAADDLQLVGQAASPKEATLLTRRLGPDVVIINGSSSSIDGIEAAYRIRKINPATGVLLVTQDLTPDSIISRLKAGVGAFIEDQTATDRLVPAIRALHQTGCYLPPSFATRFMREYMKVVMG
jgi:DNA-binding NarL/FixJ family response regulator